MTARAPRAARSLRMRLFLVILPPLLLVSVVLGVWRYEVAQRTSRDLFDRSLLVAALAIARDVAISEGDALSPNTRRIISEAGGGEVFYHVTGPGGIYVTGYAYPPHLDRRTQGDGDGDSPRFFAAEYRGDAVRVLRMSESTTIDNLTGTTVVTVWQRLSDRDAFAAALAWRAALVIGALMAALALVVWFGVQIGLRPLNDLQAAIRLRSPDDLAAIRRPVPKEVAGIVETLNRLFAQVQGSIEAHQAFISDAAHQLRNPASALLSLTETLPDVHDPDARARHEAELRSAARKSARLAEQLLSLERLRYEAGARHAPLDLTEVAAETCRDLGARVLSRDVRLGFAPTDDPLRITGDAVLLGEAIKNLLENALMHGGPGLSEITVTTFALDDRACLEVADNGKGIPPEATDTAFRRFGQVTTGAGSGLGLSIVRDVMRQHGGDAVLVPRDRDQASGATIRLSLPLDDG